jgi:tetratricopeptide (TPR) repeat protein/two-component sensor histidine kinase
MRYCLIIGIFLLPVCCAAQQKEIDSLLIVLKNHPAEDTTRLRLLGDISYDYYQLNPDEGLLYAKQLTAIAKKINNKSWEAMGYARQGLNHAEKGEYGPALDYYKQAADIFESQGDDARLFGVRNSTAITYMEVSEFSKALDIYFKNLRYCEQKNKEQAIAMTSGNIALVYKRMGNYQQALLYNQKAIDIQTKKNDEKAMADLMNSRGNMYDAINEYKKALPLYRQSLSLSEKIGYDKGVAAANSNLGNIFNELGMYDSAVYHIKNSLSFYRLVSDKSNTAVLLNFMGNIISNADNNLLLKEGVKPTERYVAANDYYKQSFQLNIETEDIAAQAENLQSISVMYKKLNQFDKALEAHERYASLRDSILSDEKLEAIQQSEKQYAVKKNEDSLLLVQQRKDIQVAVEINRQKSIQQSVIIGGSLLLLAGITSFIFYKKRRDAKQKQQEAEFNTEVSETEMKALRSQMNPHFIFNSLNSIGDYIAKNNVQEADRYLSKFAKLMRMILENSEQKDVSIADDLKALELYMQLEALRMNNKFTYEIKVDDAIDKEATLIPPLILQPFVENSIWHGIAQKEGNGKILIHIKKENEDMINCIVEDDGIGRKKSAAIKTITTKQEKTSLGMKITQSRIDILNKIKNTNAAVQVSDLAQGVRVEVKLPLAISY